MIFELMTAFLAAGILTVMFAIGCIRTARTEAGETDIPGCLCLAIPLLIMSLGFIAFALR